VVEFNPLTDGRWLPFPVEYKRGKPKLDRCDEVQLCAQAMCLEEMMDVEVPRGALFYGKIRRRHDVVFNEALRQETEKTAKRVHDLIASGITPRASYEKKCKQCSLLSICLPKSLGRNRNISRYLTGAIDQ
jgi:CRISPR-associated exonuclease Cas4